MGARRFRSAQSWGNWVLVCIFFEWECVLKRENNRYAWRSPEAVVRATPHLQFDSAGAKNDAHYYSNIRMALLAYVAFPNSVWETAYSLMNVVPNETAEKTLEAFVAEEPRAGLPPQRHPWCACPDFLRSKWLASKIKEKTDTLAAKKKDESNAPKPSSCAMRLLTWNLWGSGPLFEARLKAAARVISEIRPTIFFAQCLPLGGSDILKSSPPWRRLGMREIESPYLSTGSVSALYASPGVVAHALNPADVGELPEDCLVLHVEVAGALSVSVAVRILTQQSDQPGCLQSAGAIDDLGRMLLWVSNADRAILIASIRSPTLEEFYTNAIRDSAQHVDAWSASRPSENGFTYDGIANSCANPGSRQTPDRVCLNASLGPFLKGSHICGAKKCAKLRAPLRGGGNSVLLHPSDHFGLVVDMFQTPRDVIESGFSGAPEDPIVPPQAGDMPREEALSLYRARFDSSKVDLRAIRFAIKTLGVGIAEDATLGAVFGMVRQVFRSHEAWGKRAPRP